MNEEILGTLDDARRKLALWRYDYNNVRPHSSPGNHTPVEARRELEQFDGSAQAQLAQTDDDEYEIQTPKLSFRMREPRGHVSSDESCFAKFIATAVDGERDDAPLIATLLVRPDVAPLIASLATNFGLALKRMHLVSPRELATFSSSAKTLH